MSRMRSSNITGNLCLDIFTENRASMQQYQENENCLRRGVSEHQRMLRVLHQALGQELTPRQADCVRQYYFEEQRMVDIADNLGIHVSSVSRHLKKARSRLAQVMGYAFERLENRDTES